MQVQVEHRHSFPDLLESQLHSEVATDDLPAGMCFSLFFLRSNGRPVQSEATQVTPWEQCQPIGLFEITPAQTVRINQSLCVWMVGEVCGLCLALATIAVCVACGLRCWFRVRVAFFSLYPRGFSPSSPAYSHCPKTCTCCQLDSCDHPLRNKWIWKMNE